MVSLIQEYSWAVGILIFLSLFAGLWRTLHVLYVKPRDFRISVLEKNIEELKERYEHDRKSRSGEPEHVQQTIKTNEPPQNRDKSLPFETASNIRSDFKSFLSTWKDKSLTDLQRKSFEEENIGKSVRWRGKVVSVQEQDDGSIWVGFTPETSELFFEHAIAVFGSKHKHELIDVSQDSLVTVKGKIHSFFLSPLIRDCELIDIA